MSLFDGSAYRNEGRGRKSKPDGEPILSDNIRVLDGDTFEVVEQARLFGVLGLPWKKRSRYRLLSADAPESGQALGPEVTEYSRKWLTQPGRTLFKRGRKDKYGRMIAEVKDPEGRTLSSELIARGYAVPWGTKWRELRDPPGFSDPYNWRTLMGMRSGLTGFSRSIAETEARRMTEEDKAYYRSWSGKRRRLFEKVLGKGVY